MFDIYLVVNVLIVVGLIVLGVFALSGGGVKHHENRMFTGFVLLTSIWIIANHISNETTLSPQVSTIANYFIFSASFGAMILIMKLTAYMTDDIQASKVIKYAEPLLWLSCLISATPLTATGVELQGRVYAVIFGPFITIYGILLLSMLLATYVVLYRGFIRITGSKRARLRVLGIALSISLPLVILFSFILPSVTGLFIFTEFGVTPILILIGGFYYSIIRHRLFDVRLAVVRTVAYVLSLATLSFVYFALAFVVSEYIFENSGELGVSTSPINIVLALLLAFVFQPVKQFFDSYTDRLFFRNTYNQQTVLDELGDIVNRNILLSPLMNKTSGLIDSTLKPSSVNIFLFNETEMIKNVSVAHDHSHLSREFINQLSTIEETITIKDFMIDGDPRMDLLSMSNISLISKLKTNQGVTGFIVLGDKASGAKYVQRDIDLMAIIGDELSVAIENSLRYEEIKEFNQTLQNKVDEATKELKITNKKLQELDKSKDEFISMASHQLRTPLTSVKGYISMVLEGDIGKISPQQREVLEQAYDSSQRMVFLIGDFLNVSRIQTGKFELEKSTINFTKLVDEEVEQLKETAKMHKMTLAYDKPETEHIAMGDENKLRQVMMNFIDNAIFYSPADAVITVKLYKEASGLVFKVVDQGIGVPKEAQSKLFTKFFRASNARQQRPDGTGIGLYMAKKVIVAHEGSIIFETKEGVGSTFGFKLPLEKDLQQTSDKQGSTTDNSGRNST